MLLRRTLLSRDEIIYIPYSGAVVPYMPREFPLLLVNLCANERLILPVSSNWCLVPENLVNLNREESAGAKTSTWSQGAVQASKRKEVKSVLVSSCSHAPDCLSLLLCPIVLHHSNLSPEHPLSLSLSCYSYIIPPTHLLIHC